MPVTHDNSARTYLPAGLVRPGHGIEHAPRPLVDRPNDTRLSTFGDGAHECARGCVEHAEQPDVATVRGRRQKDASRRLDTCEYPASRTWAARYAEDSTAARVKHQDTFSGRNEHMARALVDDDASGSCRK